MKNISARLLMPCLLAVSFNAAAAVEKTPQFNQFIDKMATEHQFDRKKLDGIFKKVDIKHKIIKTMNRPAEGMPWYKYRKIFMTKSRINEGVKFWKENNDALVATEEKYGVPAQIIVAIIGVETKYGGNKGHDRVIDALSTLAFNYPKRSKFFTSELENFLILCREEKMNPLEPKGSYAGAMGIPQFMPSSYRAYAADYEEDGKRDIWNNPADAIASVANYFKAHHWKKGEKIIFPASVTGEAHKEALTKGLEPDLTWKAVQAMQVKTTPEIKGEEVVKLLSYEQEKGHDLWIALHNFYVITRYNHSALYAMAVYQLSEAIANAKK